MLSPVAIKSAIVAALQKTCSGSPLGAAGLPADILNDSITKHSEPTSDILMKIVSLIFGVE